MEEEPLAKDPATKPENYSSTETQETEVEEKKSEEITEKKKKETESSSNNSDGGSKIDFVPAIILSCLSFWLCGILFGGIAFILAVVGKRKTDSGNQEEAGRLKTASLVLSIIGIVLGLVGAIVVLVLYFTVWQNQKPIHG